MGAAIGVGLLAKYAMIYSRSRRRSRRCWCRARIALARCRHRGAAGAGADRAEPVVEPDQRAGHAAPYRGQCRLAGWRGRSFGLAKFVVGQFALAGPVLFRRISRPALARGGGRPISRRCRCPSPCSSPHRRADRGANANWAAVGHLGAVVLGIALLAPASRLADRLLRDQSRSPALPSPRSSPTACMSGMTCCCRYVGRADVSHQRPRSRAQNGLPRPGFRRSQPAGRFLLYVARQRARALCRAGGGLSAASLCPEASAA